ncbi:unnamed protein product (macronuclear) [Paramecium tetraurelia]|uniref:Uncharacterized protein n=1 Tax=Paramecium tetraurelia TaxID=5888 RepID=A0E7P3_PARTE|nr:uncharacterized protein GSPATT00024038001 [Paramecium tetraurelia]CAK91310.1 unnamed protein product [Paramecium tetraurelia]|eukprot:XP_001458707.1 hypothetical protein (macronuclear) [Paramecium tetraurelia strain d4-2]
MQQLLKPSLNFDFQEALFEDNPKLTSQIKAQQKNDLLNQSFKNQDYKGNHKNIVRPRSSSGYRQSQNNQSLNQYIKAVRSKQVKQYKSSPQHYSAKQTIFDKNKTLGVASNMQSNMYFPYQYNMLTKQSNYTRQQQMANINNKQQSQKQNQNNLQNAAIFDWDDDDDMDNRFYISGNTVKIHKSYYESIEKANMQQFLQKQKKSNIIENSIKQNQDILKQQQREIQQKLDNIEQLRMTQLLQNNLVLSQVPNQNEEQYQSDKQQKYTPKNPIQLIESENNFEYGYEEENFEIDEDNKVQNKEQEFSKISKQQLQQAEFKQSQNRLDQDNNSKKNKSNESLNKTSKKVIYKAKNAQERKQELMNMRSDLEKYLLSNNTQISKMFQELQETKEKERVMIEVSTKRQEELSQAKLTLRQLQEKFSKQQQIIEELNQKEHYANQIIQKLTENKQKYSQLWENQIEKYMACKVIARFLKGRRDRKLFTQLKRQSFINRLKQ